MRGVAFEGVKFLYDWCEERQQLVIYHCTKPMHNGKELWQALAKEVSNHQSRIRVMTQRDIDKTLFRLSN